MVSQLLFGELFEILERKGRQWLRIRCQHDNYVGWVTSQQIKPVTPSEFEAYQANFAYNLELMQAIMADDYFLPIPLGARLPNFDGLRLHLGETCYHFSGQAVFPENIKADSGLIIKLARRYLQAPYLWGGRSPFGIDSSGLVQMVFQITGYQLPREPQQQVQTGIAIDFIEQAQPADLAFFENRAGRIAHCGIILSKNTILHVHGKVRIDKIDHYGIYDESQARYTHRLRLVKRVLPLQQQQPDSSEQIPEVARKEPELF